jgi:hypothetical protein
MKKKALCVLGVVFIAIVVIGIFINFDHTKEIDQEENEDLMTMQEVRENAEVMMEKGKAGAYKNLEFADFTPLITGENSISELQTRYVGPEGNQFSKSLVREQMKTLQAFYGEDMNLADTRVGGFDGMTMQEFLDEGEEVQNLDYQVSYLYIHDEDYAQISLSSLWIDRGYEGTGPSLDEDCLDKVYYAGGPDLDDVYTTASGEMTVREGMENIENYFNNEFPISLNTTLKLQVYATYIKPESDGTNSFVFLLRHSYHDVLFEGGAVHLENDEENKVIEWTEAVLSGKDKVPFFNGVQRNRDTEEVRTIRKIVSPEKVMEEIAETIGENTVYQVLGMELGYDSVKNDEEIQSQPVWIVIAQNETDHKETRFYVDVESGQLKSEIFKN